MPRTKTAGTMFGKAKHKYLRDMISIRNPSAAKGSVEELRREFAAAATKTKKLRVMRATVLAGNRALASAKRQGVSRREKAELRKVADIYGVAADQMRRTYASL